MPARTLLLLRLFVTAALLGVGLALGAGPVDPKLPRRCRQTPGPHSTA